MQYAVIMRPENAVVFLWSSEGPTSWKVDPTTAPPEWEIWPDVQLDEYEWAEIHKWPIGTDRPEAVLCVDKTDAKHFHVFKYRRDIDASRFVETGLSCAGLYAASASLWEGLLRHRIETLADLSRPDPDPPGAMDEVLENLRTGR
jgi:hypothetical protein